VANEYPREDLIAGDVFGVGASWVVRPRVWKGSQLNEIESVALFGHPANTNLGQAHDARSPYR